MTPDAYRVNYSWRRPSRSLVSVPAAGLTPSCDSAVSAATAGGALSGWRARWQSHLAPLYYF